MRLGGIKGNADSAAKLQSPMIRPENYYVIKPKNVMNTGVISDHAKTLINGFASRYGVKLNGTCRTTTAGETVVQDKFEVEVYKIHNGDNRMLTITKTIPIPAYHTMVIQIAVNNDLHKHDFRVSVKSPYDYGPYITHDMTFTTLDEMNALIDNWIDYVDEAAIARKAERAAKRARSE
jgi:hypothetical protein